VLGLTNISVGAGEPDRGKNEDLYADY